MSVPQSSGPGPALLGQASPAGGTGSESPYESTAQALSDAAGAEGEDGVTGLSDGGHHVDCIVDGAGEAGFAVAEVPEAGGEGGVDRWRRFPAGPRRRRASAAS